METIMTVLISMVALKAMIIGSDFNLVKWLKYGRKYTTKYNEWKEQKP